MANIAVPSVIVNTHDSCNAPPVSLIDRLSAREIHVYVNGDKIIKINESIFVSVTPRGHDERVLIKTESLDGADSRFLDLITYHKLGRSFLIKLLATFMVKLSGPMELIASSFMASS